MMKAVFHQRKQQEDVQELSAALIKTALSSGVLRLHGRGLTSGKRIHKLLQIEYRCRVDVGRISHT